MQKQMRIADGLAMRDIDGDGGEDDEAEVETQDK